MWSHHVIVWRSRLWTPAPVAEVVVGYYKLLESPVVYGTLSASTSGDLYPHQLPYCYTVASYSDPRRCTSGVSGALMRSTCRVLSQGAIIGGCAGPLTVTVINTLCPTISCRSRSLATLVSLLQLSRVAIQQVTLTGPYKAQGEHLEF